MATKEKKGIAAKVEHYLALPYRFDVYQEETDEGPYWAAEVVQLKGCAGDGGTPEEAISSAREHMALWFETALEKGIPIPEPGQEGEYSGKFQVRVPKTLHHGLVTRAEREGTSLNAWIAAVLAQHGA